MTPTSPEAIAALLDGVTDGPWVDTAANEVWRGAFGSPDLSVFDRVAIVQATYSVRMGQNKCSGSIKANSHFIAAARDLVPALATERDALAARLAEVEADYQWMTGNRNGWQDSATQRWTDLQTMTARAERAEAERDTALAQLAVATQVTREEYAMPMVVAAFEVSATNAAAYMIKCGFFDANHQADKISYMLRKLTPADATAALTAMLDKARGETWEAAVAECLRRISLEEATAKNTMPESYDLYFDGLADARIVIQRPDDYYAAPATRAAKGGA